MLQKEMRQKYSEQNISINELARQCETIPYEILTSVPHRVKRIFFRE